MVFARIKVRVVADLDRHVHGDSRDGHEAGDVGVGLVAEVQAVGRHEGLDALAQGDCGRLAKLHEWVEYRCGQDVGGEAEAVEQPCGVKGAEVDDVVTQPHP